VLITDIFRYPVKGLPPDRLKRVSLTVGEGIPSDRRFAIAHGRSDFDFDRPRWTRRNNFLVVAHSPGFAAIRCSFDVDGSSVSLEIGAGDPVTADLTTNEGRRDLAAAVSRYAGASQTGPYVVVEVPGTSLTDSPRQAVSILNKSSLGDLERRVGQPIDPRRFRGNLWIDEAPAWAELDWVGGAIQIGGATLEVVERIERCAATSANPETGDQDLSVPRLLKDLYGHVDFGVLAEVTAGGLVAPGDDVRRL